MQRVTLVPMIMVPPAAVRAAEPDSSGSALQPIAPLLRDPTLTEVMINGPDAIFVEREGRICNSRGKAERFDPLAS